MLPFSKRTYSFRGGDITESKKDGSTPLRKIKSRGRTFIGAKTPTNENTQEDAGLALSPFARGSVRLKSIRKRKMANREDVKSEGASVKRGKMAGKEKDEIEMKIEDNIRMRDGVTKLLSGCHDTRQAMEIGKNLLTINSRVLSLMSSLQKKRSSNILKDHNKSQSGSDLSNNLQPCLGDVVISDIRIPLMWKQDAHFKTRPGEQPTLLYHMFCLLKINDQVLDTPLFQFSQIDTDVTFDGVFTFRNVSANFKLEIETYYSVMHNPDNPAWTPMRTPKKSTYSSAPPYCLAAHAQLSVNDVKDGFVVSDFTMGGVGASATAVLGHVDDFPDNPLALWGQFSCQLRARPSCLLNEKLESHLLFQTANGGQPVWEKYIFRLRNCTIQGWKESTEKEECLSMTPGISIKLKKGMKINIEKSTENSKPSVLILTTKKSDEKEPVFGFDKEDDLIKWEKGLEQAIIDARAWKAASYTFVDIEQFEAKKKALSRVLNSCDQFAVSIDARQPSPILPRKSVKSASKASLSLQEMTPKVKSFYDQISIMSVRDNVDGTPVSTFSRQSSQPDNISLVSESSSVGVSERLEGGPEKVPEVMETHENEVEESNEMNGKDEDVENVAVLSGNDDMERKCVEELADETGAAAEKPSVILVKSDAGHNDVKEEDLRGFVTEEDCRIEQECRVEAAMDSVVTEDPDLVANKDGKPFSETEESVLDYLAETIDSAAHLDETVDSVNDEESPLDDESDEVSEDSSRKSEECSSEKEERLSESEALNIEEESNSMELDKEKDVERGSDIIAENVVIMRDIQNDDVSNVEQIEIDPGKREEANNGTNVVAVENNEEEMDDIPVKEVSSENVINDEVSKIEEIEIETGNGKEASNEIGLVSVKDNVNEIDCIVEKDVISESEINDEVARIENIESTSEGAESNDTAGEEQNVEVENDDDNLMDEKITVDDSITPENDSPSSHDHSKEIGSLPDEEQGSENHRFCKISSDAENDCRVNDELESDIKIEKQEIENHSDCVMESSNNKVLQEEDLQTDVTDVSVQQTQTVKDTELEERTDITNGKCEGETTMKVENCFVAKKIETDV